MSLDFKMVSGDTKNLNITVKDSSGVVVDLSGSSITWGLYTVKGTTVLTKTIGSGITLTDPTNGVFQVQLTSADTSSIKGNFYHEAKIIDNAGNTLFVRGDSNLTKGFVRIEENLVP